VALLERKEGGLGVMVLLVELEKESFGKWWVVEYDIPLHQS
jgi:hypothetical protein